MDDVSAPEDTHTHTSEISDRCVSQLGLPLILTSIFFLNFIARITQIALSRISRLILAFVGGWATDRFGPKRTLKIIFLVSGIMNVLIAVVPSSYIPVRSS